MKYLLFKLLAVVSVLVAFIYSCSKETSNNTVSSSDQEILDKTFKGSINLTSLENYANQVKPNYITKNNGTSNPITDKAATLGRVLFYDKNLSKTNKIACASCHIQQFAFGDTAKPSQGVSGKTGRQSMRLVNVRFSEETKFFWDERASSLEHQTTLPIRDHAEMGFSGTNGDPSFDDLIKKLSGIDYYKILFKNAFGAEEITELKIQLALSQFIRSIQSFDSKFDVGRAQVNNNNVNFPNFTAQENTGKNLFLAPPTFDANGIRTGGGLGCGGCHRAPEFDIDPNSRSNGIGGSIAGGADFTNTRSPSLRNLAKPDGSLFTPLMHTGVIKSVQSAIGHYGNLTAAASNNPNLDPRLKPNNKGQQLNLSATEVNAVEAFLKTLTGSEVFTHKKWGNPFK